MNKQFALVAAILAVAFSSSASAGVLKPVTVHASASALPNADNELKCGGIIEVQLGQASYFQYKFEQEYENNEFCIWSVVTPGNVWRTALVTIEENGFEPNFDGVEGYYLYESRFNEAELVKVSPNPRKFLLENGLGLIVFSSGAFVTGTGFRVKIEANGTLDASSNSYFFNDNQGVFQYPNKNGSYESNEQVLAIFQHNKPNFLELTALQTESGNDYVTFLSIPPMKLGQDARVLGRWAGTLQQGPRDSLTFNDYPVVAIFLSGCCVDSSEAVGFEITYGVLPDPTTTPVPSIVNLECGGVIEFNSPHAFSVEYKPTERYANNESCVWALHSGNLWEKLIITLESEGFETGRDGIDAYYLNTTTSTRDIDFNKCSLARAGDSCQLENGVGFLAFSSDATNVGVGFRARIVAVDTINSTIDSAHFFNSSTGSFEYPYINEYPYYKYYESNERRLMIFQLTNDNPNYLDIPSIETDLFGDFVHFFTVHPFHEKQNVNIDGRWSGNYVDGDAGALSFSSGTRVALFMSDRYNNNFGFTIDWDEAPFTGDQKKTQRLAKARPAPSA